MAFFGVESLFTFGTRYLVADVTARRPWGPLTIARSGASAAVRGSAPMPSFWGVEWRPMELGLDSSAIVGVNLAWGAANVFLSSVPNGAS